MNKGFTLLEVLIATAISALLAAVVATAVPPLQAVFEQAPAAIDLQQRGRTAVDAIAQAVRAADTVLLLDQDPVRGHFRQLITTAPKPNGAQGVVAADQLGPGGELWLADEPCPGVPDVCGFVRGSLARISDGAGRFELFTVGSVDAAARSIAPRRQLDAPYAAPAAIVEVDVFTFRLDPAPGGASTLVRQTGSGAVQPVVDGVSELMFLRVFAERGIDVSVKLQSHGLRAGQSRRRMAIATRNLR